MRNPGSMAIVALMTVLLAGCGVVYQAASGHRASKMQKTLQPGYTMTDVHQMYGEPDIRAYQDQNTEIWSYAKHANTADPTALLLYTSAKQGDSGSFLDLKFVDGKLVSWNEAQHTMPPKEGGGFSIGTGGQPIAHY